MQRFACLFAFSSFALAACATDNSTLPEGGGGSGVGGQSPPGGAAPVGGESGEGGTGGEAMGCAQDCSDIDVPPCFEALCNEETGNCDVGPAEDGAECEDGEFCTTGDRCTDGVCEAGGPLDCAEGNPDPCLTAICDEALDACSNTTAPNGTVCVSDNICLTTTFCVNGQCQGAPLDCSATPLTAPECQSAQCDPANGQCVVVAINDGNPCTYGDICESSKTCGLGVCEGTPIVGCTGCTETEPNNLYSTANTGVGCASWAGGITTIGDVDCFAIDVTVPGSRIASAVTDVGGTGCPTGFDSVIRLFNSSGTQLASDDQSGDVSCSAFLPTLTATTNLAMGTYFVCVEDWLNNGTSPPYLLLLSALAPGCGNQIIEGTEECDTPALGTNTCVTEGFAGGTLLCDATCALDTSSCIPPGCGNGIQEAGEQCDDGNVLNGDNCSSTCQLTIYDCAVGEVQVTIPATGLPLAITDNMTITNTMNVPNTGTITKVALEMNITHTFDGDLDITLDSPGAAAIDLTSDNGGGGDNFTNTVFALGFPSITTGAAPFTGVFTPEGDLNTIVGTVSNGSWVLTITDDAGGDIGSLTGWTLHLCVQP